ncbi:MAG: transcriptional repressor LexA [Patescibacteria group bacterium]
MQTLTKRQKETLIYIEEYIEKHGVAPSFEEIGEYFGLSALSTVHEHVSALVDKEYLLRDERKERGLSLAKKRREYLTVPLVGTITCGTPIEAIEDAGEYIKVAREPSLRGNLFALKAKGDSMIGEGIFDGDIIIAKEQQTADNGDTVVAVIDDNEATLKKYFKQQHRIKLQPANPAFEPLYRKDVAIRGVVVRVIRRFI